MHLLKSTAAFCAVAMLFAPLAQAKVAHAAPLSTEVSRSDWGKTTDGTPVSIYTLKDAELSVRVTTFGARLVSILAPDRKGHRADVLLGYDSVAGYEGDTSTYFGAIVGRYGNRIKQGTFSIDGQTYHVPVNNHGNALHGGPAGYSTKVWQARRLDDGVEMTMVSPDGDMGFPGQLTLHVRYHLVGKTLKIDYSATTTKPTVLNPTNHAYFNLGGDGKGTILDEVLMIPADRYTPTDTVSVPTGELAPVAGTPFDFTKPTAIGARVHQDNPQLNLAKGYDHNFVLSSQPATGLHVAAEAFDPATGRTLTVKTTEPGVQFYGGNFLDGTQHGKYGVSYQQYAGFCLETQHFPDSPNEPKFPSTLLRPGQTFHSETEFIFGVR